MSELPRKRVRRTRKPAPVKDKPAPAKETALPPDGVKTTGDDALGMTPPPLREARRGAASRPVRGSFDYMVPVLVLVGIGCVVWLGLTARREPGLSGNAGAPPQVAPAIPQAANSSEPAASTPAAPETTPQP